MCAKQTKNTVQVTARTRPTRAVKVVHYEESSDDDEDSQEDSNLPYARAVKQKHASSVDPTTPTKRGRGRPCKQVNPLAPVNPTPITKKGRGRPRKVAVQEMPGTYPISPVSAPVPTSLIPGQVAPIDVAEISVFNARQVVNVERMPYLGRFEEENLVNRFAGCNKDYVQLVQHLWLNKHLTIGEIQAELIYHGYTSEIEIEDILFYLRWSTLFWTERKSFI